MLKNLIRKCLITLGLILFLSVLVPILPSNTVTAQAAETGKDKAEAYRLNVSDYVIAKGKTFPLRTYNVGADAKIYFKSGDEEIASVSGDGVISAKKVGSTTITVTIKEGSNSTSLTCNLIVGPAAISVKWTQSIVIISKDSTENLNVILKPSNTVESAKYTSLSSSIVSVSTGGRASARNYGYAELRAYIDDTTADGSKKYDSCGVIVTSEDNVAKLKQYFSEHTELNQISESDLFSALDYFFNIKFDQTSSSNLISSLNSYLRDTFNLK